MLSTVTMVTTGAYHLVTKSGTAAPRTSDPLGRLRQVGPVESYTKVMVKASGVAGAGAGVIIEDVEEVRHHDRAKDAEQDRVREDRGDPAQAEPHPPGPLPLLMGRPKILPSTLILRTSSTTAKGSRNSRIQKRMVNIRR